MVGREDREQSAREAVPDDTAGSPCRAAAGCRRTWRRASYPVVDAQVFGGQEQVLRAGLGVDRASPCACAPSGSARSPRGRTRGRSGSARRPAPTARSRGAWPRARPPSAAQSPWYFGAVGRRLELPRSARRCSRCSPRGPWSARRADAPPRARRRIWPIVELQVVVGHVDLERRVALADQRRQLLLEHLAASGRRRSCGTRSRSRPCLRRGGGSRRPPPQRCGPCCCARERNHRGRPAAGRRAGAGEKSSAMREPVAGRLVEVAVARRRRRAATSRPPASISRRPARPGSAPSGDDPPVADADVGAHGLAGGRDGAVADDECRRSMGSWHAQCPASLRSMCAVSRAA